LRLDDVGDVDQLSSQAYSALISVGLFWNKSGTAPLVIAETIFWRIGA
jgi:hypothetical protein